MWRREDPVPPDVSEEQRFAHELHGATSIPEDGILHSYRRENLKSYKI
jgi:hypothetical protein